MLLKYRMRIPQVMSNDTGKESLRTNEEMTQEEMDKWAYELWASGYQNCDLTYLEGNEVITLKDVMVGLEPEQTIYNILEKYKFIFIITGEGAIGNTDNDRLMVLNTHYVINLDLKDYGLNSDPQGICHS